MEHSDLQTQCFVKRAFTPIFQEENQPTLLYISNVKPSSSSHPRVMHAHTDRVEVILICEGASTYLIGNKQYDVKKGDLLIYNPGVVHDEISGPDNQLHSYCMAVGGLHMPGLPDYALTSAQEGVLFPTGAYFEDFNALFAMLFHSLSTDETMTESFCNSLMHAILVKVLALVKEHQESLKKQSGKKKSVEVNLDNTEALGHTIKKYIDAHYMEQITLQSISSALYISPYYLSHVFKEMSGYSPMQYVLRRRVGEAQTLLIHTDLSLTRIAENVGFETQSYFNYQFTKNVGISPKKYRDNYIVNNKSNPKDANKNA